MLWASLSLLFITISNRATPCENVSSGFCGQRRLWSDCADAQSDQGHHCSLRESLGTQNTWLETECLDDALGMRRMIWICILLLFYLYFRSCGSCRETNTTPHVHSNIIYCDFDFVSVIVWKSYVYLLNELDTTIKQISSYWVIIISKLHKMLIQKYINDSTYSIVITRIEQ